MSVLCSKCPPGIEGSLRNALSLERREKLPRVPIRRRWDVSATRADTLIMMREKSKIFTISFYFWGTGTLLI